ncbi:MAG: ferrous iron transport protein B [Oscillospiraceae bacterium]|nr:ferrous iron transport protein B [Oscillospiraceae bacterium]
MEEFYRIALAGNPNVGKSTVFNALTGSRQHTGNWAGKTVECAQGAFVFHGKHFELTDLPGIYSLRGSAAEERAAQQHICGTKPDAVIVVCDACCLERNLHLALQTAELCPRTLLCVNLMDEAAAKGISIDFEELERALGIPVIGMQARDGEMGELQAALEQLLQSEPTPQQIPYGEELEAHLQALTDLLQEQEIGVPARYAALRLLENDTEFAEHFPLETMPPHIGMHLAELRDHLAQGGWDAAFIRERITACIVRRAEEIARNCVQIPPNSDARDRKLDRIFLGKWGIPVMLCLLAGILWFTMAGANVPSELLGKCLFGAGEGMRRGLQALQAPDWCESLLIDGVWRTLAWVAAVMLPPMAIFFPLFTLLEDAGYLPRAAFLLDRPLRKSGACGKQALTMCMGLGCNACGVTGCRIIDSPKERLTAILTNVFMPCNGRFPMLMSMISMFLIVGNSPLHTALQALLLALVIVCGALVTMLVSKFLTRTILKGEGSAFTLELPPYRRPQFGKVLVRSLLDRTIFVLGRACAVAAPAGLVLWILVNVQLSGGNLLTMCANFLDPFAQFFGLDGMILLAFLLGFPANEIVVPIILMGYLAQGSLTELDNLNAVRQIFTEHGWTLTTALCTMTFSLLHFPCSTTVLTILRETKSLKWTALSVLLPTACGLLVCAGIRTVSLFL